MSMIDAPMQTGMGMMPAGPPAQLPAPAPKWHDVTVKFPRKSQRARVEAVPPEEFGIARNAKSIADAGYVFHEVIKSEAELIEQGYDEEQVKKLPSYTLSRTIEGTARDTVEETDASTGDDGMNRANRQITVTEHYVRMAYDRDDICLYKVTTAGEGDVLKRDGKDDVEQIEYIPFAAMTPVPVTHRFFGRSIADLVMDIQRIKTALLRGLLDNIYMSNMPRPVINELMAGENTLDDILVAQHGRPIRVKGSSTEAVTWQTVPDISGHVYPAIQYMDSTREWRTGVSRQGQGTDPNVLQNQVATIANQMFNAAQAKTKLIARIFAETGIRDMFSLLHAVVRKHGSVKQTVRLRNKWVNVDPRQWRERADMTINVGLGNGTQAEQIAHMTTIIAMQKEALAAGKTNLVNDANLYNSAKQMTKLVKLKDVDSYFTDPKGQPPPAPPVNPKVEEIKLKAEVEKLQATADIAVQKQKTEAEMVREDRKAMLELEMMRAELEMKREEHAMKMAEQRMAAVVKATESQKGPDGEPTGPHPVLAELLSELRKRNAPRRIIRGPDGKASHSEPVV
jgi:hypothetical protein